MVFQISVLTSHLKIHVYTPAKLLITWCHAVTRYFKNTLENNPPLSACVDTTQSMAVFAVSKHSHAIASEVYTAIAGLKFGYLIAHND